jgi:hypothetical protein
MIKLYICRKLWFIFCKDFLKYFSMNTYFFCECPLPGMFTSCYKKSSHVSFGLIKVERGRGEEFWRECDGYQRTIIVGGGLKVSQAVVCCLARQTAMFVRPPPHPRPHPPPRLHSPVPGLSGPRVGTGPLAPAQQGLSTKYARYTLH